MKFLENKFLGAYEVIIEHLKEYAERKGNEKFKEKLESSDQTSQDLINYINGEAEKQAIKGVAVISDQEVVGWAIHFIDEQLEEVESVNIREVITTPAKNKVANNNDSQSKELEELKAQNKKLQNENSKLAKKLESKSNAKKEKSIKKEPAEQISIFDLLV